MKLAKYGFLVILVNIILTSQTQSSDHLSNNNSIKKLNNRLKDQILQESNQKDQKQADSPHLNQDHQKKDGGMNGKKRQQLIISRSKTIAVSDLIAVIFFLLSAVNLIRQNNNYRIRIMMLEKQLQNQSFLQSQQTENILEMIKQNGKQVQQSNLSNLYTTFSKNEKYFLKIYDLEEFQITQRVIRYKDTIKKTEKGNTFFQIVQIKLNKLLNIFNIFKKDFYVKDTKQIPNDVENQQLLADKEQQLELNELSKSYENILEDFQNIFNKLLIKGTNLKFNKIKYFGTNKIYQNHEIKISIYLCVSKITPQLEEVKREDNLLSNQIETIITQFMRNGLKLKKLSESEDFTLQRNQIIINPNIILKHDPQISNYYYLHIYKQLCKLAKVELNQNFLQKVSQLVVNQIQQH